MALWRWPFGPAEVAVMTAAISPAIGRAYGVARPGQPWSVGRKREVVLRLLRGESAENLSRELGVPPYRLERWRCVTAVEVCNA